MQYGSDAVAFEVELLSGLSARYESAAPPSKHEIEVALELGFASLMALEARLQSITSEGLEHQPRIVSGSVGERLTADMDALRSALSELRARTGSGRASGVGGGFVLPAKR